jgi:PPOX class probable F420-dependent enzyme
VSAVDHKPKTTNELARLADIERSGRASVLVDHYDDADWSALWWVRVSGAAVVLASDSDDARAAVDVLVTKYEQYRDHRPQGPVVAVALDSVTSWQANP